MDKKTEEKINMVIYKLLLLKEKQDRRKKDAS